MSDELLELNFGMKAEAYPLNRRVFIHKGLAVFQNQVTSTFSFARDHAFLSQLEFEACFYGACDCEIHPFLCIPERRFKEVPTAAQILAELHIINFQSDFISNFDTRCLPFAGYHPATLNDEIHTDENEQYLFENTAGMEEDSNSLSVSWNSHQSLKNYVLDKHLFYVLVHDRNKSDGASLWSESVLLFALGISPNSGNLVGAISSQLCHNLCD